MKVDGGTGVHECAGIRLEMLGDLGIIVALFCLQVTSFLTAGTGTCVAGVSIHSIYCCWGLILLSILCMQE